MSNVFSIAGTSPLSAIDSGRLLDMVAQAPGFIAITMGPEHVYVLANEATKILLGTRHLVGRPVRVAIPELQGQGYFELLDQVYRSGERFVGNSMRATLKRGASGEFEHRYVSFVFQPIRDQNGSVNGIFIEGHDVTEQHLVQARLELSNAELAKQVAALEEERRQRAFELRLTCALQKEHDADVILRTAEAMLGEHLALYYCRAWRPQAQVGEALAVQTHNRAACCYPIRHGGKLVLCVEFTGARDPETCLGILDSAMSIISTSLQIADAHSLLRAERDQSQNIFDSMTEGFAIIDSDWTMLQINAVGLRVGQREGQIVVGRSLWEVWPEIIGTEVEVNYRNVMAGRNQLSFEVSVPFSNGTTLWLQLRLYPTLGGGMAVLYRDVTKDKEIEEKLRQADRKKDEFVALLAHELRNPLAPISSASQVLAMSKSSDPTVARSAAVIARQVHHLTGLIEDLMDVSRIARGEIILQMANVDLNHILSDALEQARPSIEARQHRLTVRTATAPVLLHGDSLRLVQVLSNLMSNAAKYTPQGGEIDVMLVPEDAHARVTVRDNGVGMEPAFLAQACELFAQAERSTGRSQGGLGVGLALAKKLIELHGGSIQISSDGLGKGTTVSIHLPLLQPDLA